MVYWVIIYRVMVHWLTVYLLASKVYWLILYRSMVYWPTIYG